SHTLKVGCNALTQRRMARDRRLKLELPKRGIRPHRRREVSASTERLAQLRSKGRDQAMVGPTQQQPISLDRLWARLKEAIQSALGSLWFFCVRVQLGQEEMSARERRIAGHQRIEKRHCIGRLRIGDQACAQKCPSRICRMLLLEFAISIDRSGVIEQRTGDQVAVRLV